MSVTASVCTIALFKAFAACCYAMEDGKLVETVSQGGEGFGELLAVLPKFRSDTPEKKAKNLIAGLEKDLDQFMKSERAPDPDAVLANLKDFGPQIIEANAAGLVPLIVTKGKGDWQAATGLVLGNIPEGDRFTPFRNANTPEHRALKTVLDNLHRLLFAPKYASAALRDAMVQDIRAAVDRVEKGVEVVDGKVDQGNAIGLQNTALLEKLLAHAGQEKQQHADEIERLKATIADLQNQASTGDNRATDALENIAETGDPKAAYELYRDRAQQDQDNAVENWKRAGSLAFLHDTQGALDAYRKVTILAPDDPGGWNRLGQLLGRLGEIDEAILAYERVLAIGETQANRVIIATGTGNLGVLYGMRGQYDKAEKEFRKTLEIYEVLGYDEGIAIQYGNLGNLYFARGDFDGAEKMYCKALGINEEIDRVDGMTIQYGNLGNLYLQRGNLVHAEEMYFKALKMDEKIGRIEGTAIHYGNLGNLFRERGDLVKAEEMYRKSLAINEHLHRKEGLANDYANLGFLYETRGDVLSARHSWQQSLDLFRAIGAKDKIAQVEGWLNDSA